MPQREHAIILRKGLVWRDSSSVSIIASLLMRGRLAHCADSATVPAVVEHKRAMSRDLEWRAHNASAYILGWHSDWMACGALRRDKGNGKPLPTSSVPSSSEGDWGGWGGAGDDDPDIDWVDVSRVRRNGSRESRARRRRAAPPSALACSPHASPLDAQNAPGQQSRAPRVDARKPAHSHVSRRHSPAARLL